jgi:hypothetical protein
MSIVSRNDVPWCEMVDNEMRTLSDSELAAFKDEAHRANSQIESIEMGFMFVSDALCAYAERDELDSATINDASALISLLVDNMRECTDASYVGLAGRALHFERLNKMAREALAQTSPPSGEHRGALRQIRKRRTVRRASA